MITAMYLVTTILLKLKVKRSISEYGSVVHNRLKPIMMGFVLIPLVWSSFNIEVTLYSITILALNLATIVCMSMLTNKLLETLSGYSVQSLVLIVFAEAIFIDMLIGKIPFNTLLIISVVAKLAGVWYCIRDDVDIGGQSISTYVTLLAISLMTIFRMYTSALLIEDGRVSLTAMLILPQISVAIYANVRYWKIPLKVTKEMFKNYLPEIIITTISDTLYLTMVVRGVSLTADYDIVILVIMLLVESRMEVNKYQKVGLIALMIGWIIQRM